MKKTTAIIMSVTATAFIGTAVWIAYSYFFKKTNDFQIEKVDKNSKEEPKKETDIEKIESSKFPLTIGSIGQYVAFLQAAINYKFGNNTITVDGRFGEQTRDILWKKYNYFGCAGVPFVVCEVTLNDFVKIVPTKDKNFTNYVKTNYGNVLKQYKT